MTERNSQSEFHWFDAMNSYLPPPINVPLTVLPSHECHYLPGQVATIQAFMTEQIPAPVFEKLLDAGFRRSGTLIYQPVCHSCRECLPIRIPVGRFKPTKSQRRCAKLNADLLISNGTPQLTDEKLNLYNRYIDQWHATGGEVSQANDHAAVEAFLYNSPMQTLEFCYRTPSMKLVAVGIVDVTPRVLSSVYFYFDPAEQRRGLGNFGALVEIDYAREHSLPFYHLGYWIQSSAKMNYKSRFGPAEVLGTDRAWHPLAQPLADPSGME